MSRTRKDIMSDVEQLLANAPVATWTASETPWDPGSNAQIRTQGGRLVAQFSDIDDAKLAADAVKLLRELAGLA